MSRNDVSVVLAHGAWAEGSSWRKVIDALWLPSDAFAAAFAQNATREEQVWLCADP